ncbi:MAG: aminotransferase [Chloroflexi bacterium]|nr:aminotransferase [Chloroflexota bacterium]
MKPANDILSSYGTTVFEVMSRLAMEHKAINLGQGFPDDNGPDDVRQAAADAVMKGPNQYPPMMGVPELRQAVAEHSKRFYDIDVDWQTETMVTSGATESLAACILGLLNPGDEVVLFEPLYDSYLPMIERAGGVPRLIRLEPPDWELPKDELEAAFSDKTKMVLLNNPMNPASKVFRLDELELIAELVQRYDAYALCDEVYEHIVYDDLTHIPLITLPGMRERTMKLGSAGKTFSLTGWKVGYTTASAEIISRVSKAHQFLTFTTAPNLQQAVAYGLRKEDDYFSGLSAGMQRKRDLIRDGLERIGFETAICDGTYFLNADFRPLGFDGTAEEFCRYITTKVGVAAIPVSAFYTGVGQENGASNYLVRFCFCKQDAVLEEAISRLASHFSNASSKGLPA